MYDETFKNKLRFLEHKMKYETFKPLTIFFSSFQMSLHDKNHYLAAGE